MERNRTDQAGVDETDSSSGSAWLGLPQQDSQSEKCESRAEEKQRRRLGRQNQFASAVKAGRCILAEPIIIGPRPGESGCVVIRIDLDGVVIRGRTGKREVEAESVDERREACCPWGQIIISVARCRDESPISGEKFWRGESCR